MNLFHFAARDIAHRKINFLLSLLGSAVAVGAALSVFVAVRVHDHETERLVTEMETTSAAKMAELEDGIRKSMKGLGFNLFLFPQDQDLSEVYSEGFATKTMPEDYVMKLAHSDIVTVNHLLPSLIGVRGEIPIMERPQKAPLLDPVSPGKVILGYELHHSLGLKEGDAVTFMGKEFLVEKTYAARGSRDDITVWMHLPEVQQLVGKPGLINAIQALECNCATIDRLGEIRTERKALRAEREKLAAWLLPVATVVSLVWICLLTYINVRERYSEIGVLRAVGVKGRTILGVFLIRAIFAGFIGGVLGIFAAALLNQSDYPLTGLLSIREIFFALLLAPVLASLAAWLPAFAAAQQDPVDILRHD